MQELLCHRDTIGLAVDFRQQDHELVATHPRDRVGLADASLDPPRDGLEELVPDRVAQAVVDRLEPIEVEEQHRDVLAGPPCGPERNLEAIEEQDTMRESGERIVLRLVLRARTFVHLEHEVHGDEEGQDARSGQNCGQVRRLARGTLHREQRRGEQRQPEGCREPPGTQSGRTHDRVVDRPAERRHERGRRPEAHTREPQNLEPAGRDLEHAERSEREHRIDDEQARECGSEVHEAVGFGTRESGQAQCEPDQHRVGERYEQRQRVCEWSALVHQQRAPRHQRQRRDAHECFEDHTQRTTRQEGVHAQRQPDTHEERPGERRECRRRRHRARARSAHDADEAPGREDREAELEQHPGSVLFPGGGAIEAEDAQASGHEEEHHHGEAAHDELGVADRGQGEHGRGTDRQDCHASSLAPHEE